MAFKGFISWHTKNWLHAVYRWGELNPVFHKASTSRVPISYLIDMYTDNNIFAEELTKFESVYCIHMTDVNEHSDSCVRMF